MQRSVWTQSIFTPLCSEGGLQKLYLEDLKEGGCLGNWSYMEDNIKMLKRRKKKENISCILDSFS